MAIAGAGPSSRPAQSTRLDEIEFYSATSPIRLKSIYSDISLQKVSNPATYTSNLEWWKRTLQAFVSKGLQQPDSHDVLILSASPDIVEKLRYEGVGKPLGLATVIVRLSIALFSPPFCSRAKKQVLSNFNSLFRLASLSYESSAASYLSPSFSAAKPQFTLTRLSLRASQPLSHLHSGGPSSH